MLVVVPDAAWRGAFATAVAEVAANIVRHAFPAGRPDPRFRLRLGRVDDSLEAVFLDRGIPFGGSLPATLPVLSLDDLETLPEGGMGLALAEAAVDLLRYERSDDGENRWTLRKRLPPAPPGP